MLLTLNSALILLNATTATWLTYITNITAIIYRYSCYIKRYRLSVYQLPVPLSLYCLNYKLNMPSLGQITVTIHMVLATIILLLPAITAPAIGKTATAMSLLLYYCDR